MSSEDPSKAPASGATKTESDKDKDTVWTPQVRRKFETKHKSEYLDPCQEAAARSIRCLHRNGGDKALCQDYFQAYRDCKRQWQEKRLEDKRKKKQEQGGGWFS